MRLRVSSLTRAEAGRFIVDTRSHMTARLRQAHSGLHSCVPCVMMREASEKSPRATETVLSMWP